MKLALAIVIGSILALSLIATLGPPVWFLSRNMVYFRVDDSSLPTQFVQYVVNISGIFIGFIVILGSPFLWGLICWIIYTCIDFGNEEGRK